MLDLIRPHPHRGDLIAAGALPLAVGVALVNVRMDGVWGQGVFLVLSALACALVLGMGWLAPLEGERPRSYQATLLLVGLALLLVTLLRLAQVIGVERPLRSAGTVVWITGVLAAVSVLAARLRRCAVCALVACVTGTAMLLAFVDWVFEPHGVTTSRWVLVAVAIGLVFGSLRLRGSHRRESVYLVDAAGLAVLAIAFTAFGWAGSLDPGRSDLGTWWEIVLVGASFGLAAYAGVDGERGPGYLAAVGLLAFVVLAGPPGLEAASLVGWPLLLLIVGGLMVAAGLRPREQLPPEPGEDPAPPTELWPEPPSGD